MSIDTYVFEEPHILRFKDAIHRKMQDSDAVAMLVRGLAQVYEVLRHKYFLSEKAGHDVGYTTACADFSANYSQSFFERWEENALPTIIVMNTPDLEVFSHFLGKYEPKPDSRLAVPHAA